MSKIIAEIGVNWSGNINIAKDMILQSKRAGADFVKFQMFNDEVIKDSKYKNELSEMILNFETLNMLRGYAFQQYIGFGVSVMYHEAFDIIRNIGVPVDFIKIRCQDNANEIIAKPAVKYCDEVDIPLLISTEKPIHYDYMYNLHNTPHANYLYCIPRYPPELNNIYNSYINLDKFDGYSNHFPSPYLPMIAVARKLEFIEIHIKKGLHIYRPGFDCCTNSMLDENQIDENVSIDFNDLKEVCDFRDIISKLGR